MGRASYRPLVRYKSFLYQAASWKTARRVVAKVEFHFGELFPRVGFIVTNLTASNRAVVRFYNKRGRAEQWIKEGKQAVAMTRLSCHRFRSNEVRLWLSVIAYNLGNLWRRLALPTQMSKSSPTQPKGSLDRGKPQPQKTFHTPLRRPSWRALFGARITFIWIHMKPNRGRGTIRSLDNGQGRLSVSLLSKIGCNTEVPSREALRRYTFVCQTRIFVPEITNAYRTYDQRSTPVW